MPWGFLSKCYGQRTTRGFGDLAEAVSVTATLDQGSQLDDLAFGLRFVTLP